MKPRDTNPTRQAGIALLALLAIVLVLGVVTYAFVGIVSTHRLGVAHPRRSVKAFYLAESGLQVANQWLYDNKDTVSWHSPTSFEIFTGEPLGDGTFSATVIYEGGRFFSFTASGSVGD